MKVNGSGKALYSCGEQAATPENNFGFSGNERLKEFQAKSRSREEGEGSELGCRPAAS
jgi:hypothetical protein